MTTPPEAWASEDPGERQVIGSGDTNVTTKNGPSSELRMSLRCLDMVADISARHRKRVRGVFLTKSGGLFRHMAQRQCRALTDRIISPIIWGHHYHLYNWIE